MEYQKTIILLDDTTNQPSKVRKRNWVQINNELQEACNDDDNNNDDNKNLKFKRL